MKITKPVMFILINILTFINCKQESDLNKNLENTFNFLNSEDILSDSVGYYYNNDTLRINLIDTITLLDRYNGYENLKANYVISNIIQYLNVNDKIVVNKTYRNPQAETYIALYSYDAAFKLADDYYLSNKPFRQFSIYMLDTLNEEDITELQLVINALNDYFLDFNVNTSIVELVAQYSIECLDFTKGDYATNRIFAIYELVASAPGRSPRVTAFMNFLLSYSLNKPDDFKAVNNFTLREKL